MEQIIKKMIGQTVHTFVVTGKNLHECVMESQKLSFPNVTECGLCGSDDLTLGAHLGTDGKGDEVFKYTDIKCGKCRASLTFGQPKKDPDTFYLRKNDKNENDWKPFLSPEPVKETPKPQQNNKLAVKQAEQVSQSDKPKYCGMALNFATKLATAKDIKILKEISQNISKHKHFTDAEKSYLNSEFKRKAGFFNQAQV